MELTFKRLESILATHFGVNDDGEAAFRGRIQHLQRAKIPAGVNTGKGRPAVYRWSQVIELIVVLDLIDAGMSPDAARRVIECSRKSLLEHAASFADGVSDSELLEWVSNERCPLESSKLVTISIGALHALSGGEDILYNCMDGPKFVESIFNKDSYELSSCLLNISKRILTVMNNERCWRIINMNESEDSLSTIRDFRNWSISIRKESH